MEIGRSTHCKPAYVLGKFQFWIFEVIRVHLRLSVAAIAFALSFFAHGALAQPQYPAKSIRIIVPLAAGGPSDLLARAVGQKMSEAWGQPVVIDNRAGANGVVGCEIVARSAPDGYTLLMGTSGTHGINASLNAKLPYDTINDFAPIARLGVAPYVLVAHPSLPVQGIADLLRLARARPGEIAIAAGGSASQLASELFKSMARINLLLIPYKGNSLAVTAVLSGEVSLVFGNIAQSLPQVKAGRLRALGVTSYRRSPVMPDVKTIAESGVAGFDTSTWYGMLAPAGTPRVIVEKINSEIVRVLQLPDVRERLAAEAFELPADTPEQFAAIIKGEMSRWAKLVRETGARVE
jgi:tripartite-type tricarboxylate transporter receptor subunit TctC